MELLFSHSQVKKDKKNANESKCELSLTLDNNFIIFNSSFVSYYFRSTTKKEVRFVHELVIDTETGDFNVKYNLINKGFIPTATFKNRNEFKKNNFKMLENTTESGIVRGEKKLKYWGVEYQRSITKLYSHFEKILKSKIKNTFYLEKDYVNDCSINHFYDLIVDFHLDKKDIKPHDYVYFDIQNEYPNKKFLKKNENKFLPAVLDQYEIKSKYLIKELSSKNRKNGFISSVNYICKLFGDNHVEYLKKIPWKNFWFDMAPNKKTHTLRNEYEKKCMIELMNNWKDENFYGEPFLHLVNKLLSVRELEELKEYNLKFNSKNNHTFNYLYEIWEGHKLYVKRGYKLKYEIDETFKNYVEEEINVANRKFKPKLILSEDDFKIVGLKMKNCMSKQFFHGMIYLFVDMECNNKHVNLQYKKGNLIQSYAKANTDVPTYFIPAIQILTDKFKEHSNIKWKKEKFDYIKK